MLPIFIPSLKRSDNIMEGPICDIPMDLWSSVYYVVKPDEKELYRSALPGAVNLLTCSEKGIAATRFWIGSRSDMMGWEKFIMLDDDIRFLIRKTDDHFSLRGTEPHEVGMLMSWVETLLEDYGHVGISAREGQNNLGNGGPELKNDNTRTLRALAYRTKDFLSVEHGRVDVMEDFDVNLQLLRKGIPNTNIGYWAQGQKMTNAPGGCSEYRSHEIHERSAHRLAELHPGFVKTRQKENKTDREGFGTRTEVTIYWKKAFASATQ